jgi:hypothetical protein
MKRKGCWLSGLALAALLAISSSANAGVWVGLRAGPPHVRHGVIIEHAGPGRVWVAGHWGWGGERHVWLPGRWIVRHPEFVRVDGWHGRGGWGHREGYRRWR